jgi:hypothetical protein
VIYAVCYQKQPDTDTRQRIVDFLRWATQEGQPHAETMSYAKLPGELVTRIERRLETIKT